MSVCVLRILSYYYYKYIIYFFLLQKKKVAFLVYTDKYPYNQLMYYLISLLRCQTCF